MVSKDKRKFKRYFRESKFFIKHNNKLLKAELTDYSLDGLGTLVNDSPDIVKGDVLVFNIQDPEIMTSGEVMWTNSNNSVLKIGIKNIGPIKGLIRDFRFADTLIGLQRSLKTGILIIHSENIVKKIYVKNGDMIFSASNQDEDRLGDMLLKEGRINLEQYNHSVDELKRTKQRQGEVLVRLGYLKPYELVIAVRHQVEEIILSIFTLEHGRFVFEEMPLPTDEVITLKLSAANLIYYGIKRINNIHFIRNELPPINTVFCFSPDPLNLFQDLKLDNSGKKIVSCMDGKTAIKDIISITRLDSFEVLKTIYALMHVRMIEIKPESEPFSEAPADVIEGIFEEKVEQKINQNDKDIIENMHKNFPSLGYYGILGVKDHVPTAEIKNAYYKAAKKFHPDVHFYYADDYLKNKLSDIFSYVYDAYATLSSPQKRKEYDNLLSVKTEKVTSLQDKARAKFNEGKDEVKKNNYNKAELLFGQATYFDGTMAEYHYYYGLTLVRLNKLKDAEKAVGRANKLEPSNAKYITELGFIYLNLGFPARAKGLFEKALKITPDNARAKEGISQIKID